MKITLISKMLMEMLNQTKEELDRYSVCNDTEGFMEIEAVGGCPPQLYPGKKMTLTTETCYTRI
jgi:hypothetical protein